MSSRLNGTLVITYNIHIYHVGLTDYHDFMFE